MPTPVTDARQYRATVRLRDGTPATIRAVRPDDKESFRSDFHLLSPGAIYHRFFQNKQALTESELRYLTEVDFHQHVALVVELIHESHLQIVGVARFVRVPRPGATDRAEIAFVVGDQYQNRGIGTLLLEHLAGIARGLGYRAFEAEVMSDNRPMLAVFEHSGLRLTEKAGEGLVHVELAL